MLRCLPTTLWAWGIALFAIFAWIGYLLGAKPPPAQPPKPATPPPVTVTLDFYGYDTYGNPVGATDQFGAHLNNLPGQTTYELTRTAGSSLSLTFTPDAPDRYKRQPEKVTWLLRQQYMNWLDQREAQLKRAAPQRENFWHQKFDSYRTDVRRADKNTFKYPVIFESQRR